jgi:RimJ/RimL family protein N-acetyltransferase
MTLLLSERLLLRPVTAEDADTVIRWRNSDEARAAFWCTDVVTHDTHRMFLATRRAHEYVWMAETIDGDREPVGMGALTVDVAKCEAEWGKIFVAPAFRRGGYGQEMVKAALKFAFDVLNLKRVWIEAWASNTAILAMYRRIGLRDCLRRSDQPLRERPTAFMEITREMWRAASAAA